MERAQGRQRSTRGRSAAAPARAGAAPRAAVRQRASVLVADLRGLTRLSVRLRPEAVVALLDDFFTVMTDVAVVNGAVVDRIVGDAMILLFGVPSPRREDGTRAVRTAIEMQRAFLSVRNRWLRQGRADESQLGLGIGVATGDIVIAQLSSPACRERTAIGEPVNRAFKLCGGARVAESLIDEPTYAAARAALEGQLDFTPREVLFRPRDVVSAYRVQRRRAALQVVPSRPAVDPVCGVSLAPRGALRRRRAGVTYYFCSHTCARRFLDDPDAYAGGNAR